MKICTAIISSLPVFVNRAYLFFPKFSPPSLKRDKEDFLLIST